MKGLPSNLRLRLLENDPTPSLDKMRDFVCCYRAIHSSCENCDLAATCTSGQNNDSLQSVLPSIDKFTAAVATLAMSQETLKAALEEHGSSPQQQPSDARPMSRLRRSSLQQDCQRQQRCVNCNEIGHFAANCPWDPHCSFCRGRGHTKTQYANNYLAKADSFGFGASHSQAEPNIARIPG